MMGVPWVVSPGSRIDLEVQLEGVCMASSNTGH